MRSNGQRPKILIFKEGSRTALGNSCPINLSNVSYKIYAKALQRGLEPILMEIVSFGHSTFFLLRFILHNIILIHEMVMSTRVSK